MPDSRTVSVPLPDKRHRVGDPVTVHVAAAPLVAPASFRGGVGGVDRGGAVTGPPDAAPAPPGGRVGSSPQAVGSVSSAAASAVTAAAVLRPRRLGSRRADLGVNREVMPVGRPRRGTRLPPGPSRGTSYGRAPSIASCSSGESCCSQLHAETLLA